MTGIKTITDIDPAHRVLNIGQYNNEVCSCGFCASDKRIDTLGQHCLGFGTPKKISGYGPNNSIAVVYECPNCFERQWSHASVCGGYRLYQKYLKRTANDA